MLEWASAHAEEDAGIFCCLDNQGYSARLGAGFECLLAVGAADRISTSAGHAFASLKTWADSHHDWLFGHFSYDLVWETEAGQGASQWTSGVAKVDPVGFPDLFFFIPETVIQLGPDTIRIGCLGNDPGAIWERIRSGPAGGGIGRLTGGGIGNGTGGQTGKGAGEGRISPFTPRFTRAEYRECINDLQRHIRRGDCYEINFCQEFYSQPADLDPFAAWQALGQASPNPFSCFYRLPHRYLLCASPERYLKKAGDRLFSQPIKGTSARHPGEDVADEAAASQLYHSAKDRSENVMVVDLVRNDLSRVCVAGTVQVEELYGIYPFPQVFQMISTITGQLQPGLHWSDAIRETFPMGSMTGAPKRRVVELIDRYERSRRGIFSGAVGYVTPDGDFDFNVVIRSLMYNRADRYLSYQVGSGITSYSNPDAEYEECLMKAKGILNALERV